MGGHFDSHESFALDEAFSVRRLHRADGALQHNVYGAVFAVNFIPPFCLHHTGDLRFSASSVNLRSLFEHPRTVPWNESNALWSRVLRQTVVGMRVNEFGFRWCVMRVFSILRRSRTLYVVWFIHAPMVHIMPDGLFEM